MIHRREKTRARAILFYYVFCLLIFLFVCKYFCFSWFPIVGFHKRLCKKLRSHQSFRSEDTFFLCIHKHLIWKWPNTKFRSLTHALKDQCLCSKNWLWLSCVADSVVFWWFFLLFWMMVCVCTCVLVFGGFKCNHVYYYSIMAGVLNVRYIMYSLGNILVTYTFDRLNNLRKNSYQKYGIGNGKFAIW